jgi:Domain of unknown function (DUF5666)
MKRFFLGLFVALTIALLGNVAQTSAAPSAPPPGVGGQVTAVSGTTITVKTPQGTAAIATTSSTTFQIDGKSGSLSGIKVGMFVRAEGAKAADGSFTATRVVASSAAPQGGRPPKGPPPGVGGQVTAVSGTTITVKTPQGTTAIATTSSTTFQIDGKSGSLSGIKVGMFVHAEGSKAADGAFTATRVVANSTPPSPPKRP